MYQSVEVSPAEIAVMGIRGVPASYGGFETCAEQITRVWAERGYSVVVYCRSTHYRERMSFLGNVRLKHTFSITFKSLDTLTHTFFSVVDLLLFERQIKLVHLYNTGNGIFVPLLRLFGRRVVVSGDGLEWKREKWGTLAKFIHKIGERMASAFADRIVVDNEEVRKYHAATYRTTPCLISYGAKVPQRDSERSEQLLARYGLERGKYFLFVGRFVPEKGVHSLIQAYKGLNTDYPLVIIGDNAARTAYRDELFSHQSERIRLLGFLYGEDCEQLLCNALMYVSASSLEGTSPSLLAAMGARVCPLVNGIEENRAAAQGAAMMFEKNDFDDLRSKWQKAIDDPASISLWAEKGYRHVLANYRWDAIADQYLELFRQFAEKPEALGDLR